MNLSFPNGIIAAVKLDKLYKVKDSDKRLLSERLSSRMVKSASVLSEGEYIGWQMAVPVKGIVRMSIFGTGDVSRSDLEWIAEKTGKTSSCSTAISCEKGLDELFELYLPIAENGNSGTAIGFGSVSSKTDDGFSKWPAFYSSLFAELISVLQKTGAVMRAVVGAASEEEQHFIEYRLKIPGLMTSDHSVPDNEEPLLIEPIGEYEDCFNMEDDFDEELPDKAVSKGSLLKSLFLGDEEDIHLP